MKSCMSGKKGIYAGKARGAGKMYTGNVYTGKVRAGERHAGEMYAGQGKRAGWHDGQL